MDILRSLGGIMLATVIIVESAASAAQQWVPDIPKVWDEAALADWVTPVAGLNVRPAHMSEKDYYSMPEYNLRASMAKNSRPFLFIFVLVFGGADGVRRHSNVSNMS